MLSDHSSPREILRTVANKFIYWKNFATEYFQEHKIERGEVGPMEAFRDTHIARATKDCELILARKEFSREFSDRNRSLTLPALLMGLEGDASSKAYYQHSRLISVVGAVPWIKELVTTTVQNCFYELKSKKVSVTSDGKTRRTNLSLPSFGYSVVQDTCLDGILTFDGGEKLSKRIAALNISDNDPTISKDCGIPFSVCATGEIGRVTRKAFHQGFRILFAAQVVDDYFHSQNIPLDPKVLTAVATQLKDPWKIKENGLVKKIFDLRDYIDNKYPVLSDRQRNQLLNQSATVSSPYDRVDVGAQNIIKKELNSSKTELLLPVEKTQLESQPVIPENNFREHFITGVSSAIENHFPKIDEPKIVAKKFFALFRRGAATYESIIEGIINNQDPFELMEKIYVEGLQRKYEHQDFQQEVLKAPVIEAKAEEKILNHEISVEKIVLAWGCPYDQWLQNLSPEHFQRVEARVFRLESGNLGDHKKLRRNMPLFEARIHCNGGLRIYFARLGQNKVLLIGGGTKETQRSDIESCIKNWQDFLEENKS